MSRIPAYGEFTERKAADQWVDLRALVGHPALRTASQELHTAWDEIRRL